MKSKYHFAIMVIVSVCSINIPILLGATHAAEKAKRELPAGVHLIKTDAPTSWPASMEVMDSGRLHQPYQHVKCGGWIHESNELNDNGMIELRCTKCGKKWNKKVGTPIK